MKRSTGTYDLMRVIIEKSEAKIFNEAITEWDVIDLYDGVDETCICGKEHIVKCSIIKNRYNDIELGPIGSKCIEKFGTKDMADQYETLRKNELEENRLKKKEMKRIEKKRQEILGKANKKFENVGKKCHGLTFDFIAKNCKDYIVFIKENGRHNRFKELVEYYDMVTPHAV